jgi:Ran GTPase-activating protein (RanGAP) involved in mRNA processing and transport
MKYSSFMNWVDETCRQVDELEKIGIDPGSSSAFADGCYDNPHMMRLRASLQKNQTVCQLTLRNMVVGRRGGAWLQAVLCDTIPRLLALHLEDTASDDDQANFVAVGIAQGLQYNRCLERLHLDANHITDASSLGFMLSKNNSLLELRLCHNRIDLKSSQALCAGLKDNMTLQVLGLTGNGMDDCCISEVARGLRHHSSVQFLCLDFNNFGTRGVAAISNMLQSNSILVDLHLFGNHIDAEGGRLLAASLKKNIRLSTLILSFNNLGGTGASYLAEALVVNRSLKKLWLPANHLGDTGIRAFADRLPDMMGLQQLNIGDYFDNDAARAMLRTIQHNMELQVLYMESVLYDDEATEREIDYYVRLNNAGRKLLCNPSFPTAMWPHVLARADAAYSSEASPDVLYYLLREKPDLFEQTK